MPKSTELSLMALFECFGNEKYKITGWGKSNRGYGLKPADFDDDNFADCSRNMFNRARNKLLDNNLINYLNTNKTNNTNHKPRYIITPSGVIYLLNYRNKITTHEIKQTLMIFEFYYDEYLRYEEPNLEKRTSFQKQFKIKNPQEKVWKELEDLLEQEKLQELFHKACNSFKLYQYRGIPHIYHSDETINGFSYRVDYGDVPARNMSYPDETDLGWRFRQVEMIMNTFCFSIVYHFLNRRKIIESVLENKSWKDKKQERKYKEELKKVNQSLENIPKAIRDTTTRYVFHDILNNIVHYKKTMAEMLEITSKDFRLKASLEIENLRYKT